MTEIHESATCTRGENGGRCEMCQFARNARQANSGLSEDSEGVKISPSPVSGSGIGISASTGTIRAAILDVLDNGWQCSAGCDLRHPWAFPTEMFDGDTPPDDDALKVRQRFADGVIERIAKLNT